MRASLARPCSSTVPLASPVSAAKPTSTCPGRRRGDQLGQDVRILGERDRRRSGGRLLDLVVGVADGRKSATAAAITTTSASSAALCTASRSSAARHHAHDVDAGRVGQLDVRGDEGDPRAARRGDAGQRVALPPGGAVAQEPHRVERFAGAARADHHVPAGQVARQRVGPRQQQLGQLGDLGRLRPAGPCRCRRR